MPDTLRPPGPASDSNSDSSNIHDKGSEQATLRILSRTPQPYHHQTSDKFALSPPSSSSFAQHGRDLSLTAFPTLSREQTSSSCSGTEADDEHFLKGLPAPRQRLHKGLRGRNEPLSGTSTPLPSPAILEEEGRGLPHSSKKGAPSKGSRVIIDGPRRRKEIIRRLCELVIIGSLGIIVQANSQVRPILRSWSRELCVATGLTAILLSLYPLRLIIWAFRNRTPSKPIPISLPTVFDPAPLLYPPAITLFVSSLIAVDNDAVLLPNIVLAISSLPSALIPAASTDPGINPLHWAISCLPLFLSESSLTLTNKSSPATISAETITLLYPLHVNLCLTLHALTTTSLLPAELQLLSIALINVLFLSSSPQAIILKAGLWVGGLDLLVFCSHVVLWGIALARVPKWRFRRATSTTKPKSTFFHSMMPWKKVKRDIFHMPLDSSSCSSHDGLDDQDDSDEPSMFRTLKGGLRTSTINVDGTDGTGSQNQLFQAQSGVSGKAAGTPPRRRHTLPSTGESPRKAAHAHTPSGRRKRSASWSVRAFFSLTQEEAAVRKWQYAAYVYVCIGAALFAPVSFVGILEVVKDQALRGNDAVGWALGYMFGDLPAFRWQVVSHNLERWICLPERRSTNNYHHRIDQPPYPMMAGGGGWIAHLRHAHVGEANTRLLMCAYFAVVIAAGLAVVLRLSARYEVDTRRKVFHFMMVAMFLPLTYVDPAFVALALAVILVLFLLLDLLRASQLPPLSRPLAAFLAPYVDGRDLRGPVVVSHIFLLVGCAIPLWLSLGSLPRTDASAETSTTTTSTSTSTSATELAGTMAAAAAATAEDAGHYYYRYNFAGWEVPAREVAMVSGVVCVGLGDAAASLVGRRLGHRKWLWGGGKSLEGSAAFALAVFAGLAAARAWLRFGGWPSPSSSTASSSSSSPSSPYFSFSSPTIDADAGRPPDTNPDPNYNPLRGGVGVGAAAAAALLSKMGACAAIASLTEAVLTGGNDNVIVPVVLWTCVKSLGV